MDNAKTSKPLGNGSQLDEKAFSGAITVEGFVVNTETVKGTSRKGSLFHLQKTTLLCGNQMAVMVDAKRGDGPEPAVPTQGSFRRFHIIPSLEDKGVLQLNGMIID